jgi:hypothetical protein
MVARGQHGRTITLISLDGYYPRELEYVDARQKTSMTSEGWWRWMTLLVPPSTRFASSVYSGTNSYHNRYWILSYWRTYTFHFCG